MTYFPFPSTFVLVLIPFCLFFFSSGLRSPLYDLIRLPSDDSTFIHPSIEGEDDVLGTRWSVLVAGSSGYWNYRHQADICHAYQLLRKGGLKEENIIVFMYDDIAFNEENPHQGTIINSPNGNDVYEGVPKDYTGEDVTLSNFFAVLLGNRSAVTGGSGKVLNSGPKDHIFIYYSDHGGPGVLGLPTYPYLYADDLVDTLKKMHSSEKYKSMAMYVEACESGSMFEGLLPEGLNIYVTTASNAEESSWGTYCPGEYPSPPPEYETCLGDLYSVAWMEDSDKHNLRTETLGQQYELVKRRTANRNFPESSHVMQYGDACMRKDDVFEYMGSNPANENNSFVDQNSLFIPQKSVNQHDADLLHFWEKYSRAPEGSTRKVEAQKEFLQAVSHREHIDSSMELVGKLLFGIEKGPEVTRAVRPSGFPLVDDWGCLKTLVRKFEEKCGSLSQYGMKHMRSIANMCNAGIEERHMGDAAAQACRTLPSLPWSSLRRGFTA